MVCPRPAVRARACACSLPESWRACPSRNTKIGDIDICKHEDGRDWLLGKGSYGQVYKACRGGVQDVALKLLLCRGEDQLLAFEKVLLNPNPTKPHTHAASAWAAGDRAFVCCTRSPFTLVGRGGGAHAPFRQQELEPQAPGYSR